MDTTVSRRSAGALQLNIWIPDQPGDDPAAFLNRFGTPARTGIPGPDFAQQTEAMLAAHPTVVSSIMGLFASNFVQRLHDLSGSRTRPWCLTSGFRLPSCTR